MTGSMSGAANVFETATSVTPAGSRPESRQARTISCWTRASPLDCAGTFMGCLYRTGSAAATSNEWPAVMLIDIGAGDGRQCLAIGYLEYTIFPPHRLGQEKASERLVRVHERHSERVGEMLLREWKLDRAVLDQTCFFGAHVEMQQQVRRTLERRAPSKAHKVLVDKLLLARGEPGDVKGQRR